MKKVLLCILALIAFVCTSTLRAEEEKWEWMGLHNPVSVNAYNKVFAIGKDTVFLVGEQGVVLRSLNGLLESWDIQNIPEAPALTGIHFRNAHEGYLVGGKRIYRTQDGGENWSPVYQDGTETLSAICCVGTTTIWAVGTNGRILKSNDKGEAWQKVELAGVTANLTGVAFNHKGYGMITGYKNSIHKTVDFGEHWDIHQDEQASDPYNHFYENPQIADSIGIYGSCFYYNFHQKTEQEIPYSSSFETYCLRNDTTTIIGLWCIPTGGSYGQFSLLEKSLNGAYRSISIARYNKTDIYAGRVPSIHYGDSVTGYLTQHGIVIRTVPEGYVIPNSIKESNQRDLSYKIKDGTLTIIDSKYDIDQLSIINLTGQSLVSKKVKGQQTEINLSGLSSGVFIVRLNYENNRSYSFKISVP